MMTAVSVLIGVCWILVFVAGIRTTAI